jgi:hypothetical protein
MLANWTIDRHLMPIVFVAANATGHAQLDRPDADIHMSPCQGKAFAPDEDVRLRMGGTRPMFSAHRDPAGHLLSPARKGCPRRWSFCSLPVPEKTWNGPPGVAVRPTGCLPDPSVCASKNPGRFCLFFLREGLYVADMRPNGLAGTTPCFSRPCRQPGRGRLPDDRQLQSSLLFHHD